MAIQGLRTTGNFAADERPKSWREGILRIDPNGNVPLTALTSQMKSRKVDDPEFNWWEKPLQTRRYELHATSGDLTLVNTTLTLASGQKAKGLKEGDILWVEQTGEQLRVAANPASDTSIVVERGYGGTTAATLDANGAGINPNLLCIGSVYEEGSLAPVGVSFDPTKKYNYTQIFRNSLEATRTAMKTRLRTEDAVKEAKRECSQTHMQDMERAFWLGVRYEGTNNGKPARSTGGIKYWLDNYNGGSNVKNANTDHGSGVEMQHLEEYLYEIFRYGSSEKMAFCGNRSLLTIQQIIRKNSQFNITSGIKEYGMNVSRFDTPFGTLVLKNHPLFNQVSGGTTSATAYYGMESWMFVLDMANLQYTYIDDTQYQSKLEQNGLDGMQSGYLTEAGLELHHPESFYLIKDLRLAKVDA